jgi:2-polyprenyl-3-methyl-5-hydroxy-6-metoxy-1,4-benzoquinol methylase
VSVAVDAPGYVPFNPLPWSAHSLLVQYAGRDGRVLELGCSSGYVSERLAANGNAVVGVEFDPGAAEAARAHCERVEMGDLEAMELPGAPGEYDAVVCGDILEHLRDPRALLARVQPLLRPGGRLVASTPNVANWSIRLRLLFGSFRYADRGLMDRTHTHFFTRATLAEALRDAGYEVERMDATIPSVVRARPLRAAAHGLALAFKGLLAHQLVAVAQPRR